MKTKEQFLMYVKIAEKAEKMGIYKGKRSTLLMDIESADIAFKLDLKAWLNADNENFSHDLMGIVNNINRSNFPSTDFNLFVPRYAENK